MNLRLTSALASTWLKTRQPSLQNFNNQEATQ
jgi:hypothetical protein